MNEPYIPIHSWAEDERPRERLLQHGAAALSLNELFALLLRSGVGGESALELARRIMADNRNDLNELAKRGVRELMNKYKGVGVAKAAAIVAAMEIGRRRQPERAETVPQIVCSRDAYECIRPFLADLEHEEFWVLYLNKANRVQGNECVSVGGMTGTPVDMRVLFRGAIERKAVSIIVAHNHPSGEVPRPSREDEAVTRKIFEAGKVLDIALLDHIILSGDGYYSFLDGGRL